MDIPGKHPNPIPLAMWLGLSGEDHDNKQELRMREERIRAAGDKATATYVQGFLSTSRHWKTCARGFRGFSQKSRHLHSFHCCGHVSVRSTWSTLAAVFARDSAVA